MGCRVGGEERREAWQKISRGDSIESGKSLVVPSPLSCRERTKSREIMQGTCGSARKDMFSWAVGEGKHLVLLESGTGQVGKNKIIFPFLYFFFFKIFLNGGR